MEETHGAGLVFAEEIVFSVVAAGGGVEAVFLCDGDGADGAAGGVGAGLDAIEPEDVGEDAPAFDGVRAAVGDGEIVGGAGAVGAVDGAEAAVGDLDDVGLGGGGDCHPVAGFGGVDVDDGAVKGFGVLGGYDGFDGPPGAVRGFVGCPFGYSCIIDLHMSACASGPW